MVKLDLTNLEKKVILAEVVFVFIVLVCLFFLTAPNQIYPLSGMTISELNFNLEIQNGEEVLVSIDEGFFNPVVLQVNDEVELFPGIYYWKVRGNLRESEVRNFTIESRVGLEIKEREENYELENSGNVDLEIKKDHVGITSLSVGEIKKVEKDNSTYEGEQS